MSTSARPVCAVPIVTASAPDSGPRTMRHGTTSALVGTGLGDVDVLAHRPAALSPLGGVHLAEHSNSTRFELRLGLGCPHQFLSQHGRLAARQQRLLGRHGAPLNQRIHSPFRRRTFVAPPRAGRALTLDQPAAACGWSGEHS
jgi:hypothetical protein